LKVKYKGSAKDLEGIDVLVKQKGTEEILQVQRMNRKKTYLVGDYHLEVLTLPRLSIADVRVSQNHTTKVEVPLPGQVLLEFSSPGHGAIFHEKNGERKKVTDIDANNSQKEIQLLPGDYTVVYRPSASKRSFYSKSKEFTVRSSRTTKVSF
jgi:Ca-activated chloride channel family protein